MFYPVVPTPEEIKALRIKSCLTNYQAANLINVNLSSWLRYEAGTIKPTVFNWALFLNSINALDLPPDDELTPFAYRALSFVPPVALKAGNEREGYVSPTPEEISKLRKKVGLKRAQCNKLLGLKSATHWGKYERGEIVMSEREWVIFQVAVEAIEPPKFSDFKTAYNKVPSYSKVSNFIPPTPEEIRDFLKKNDLTQAQAAEWLVIGERSFRRYVSHTKPCKISATKWKLLKQLSKQKIVLPENPNHSEFPQPRKINRADGIEEVYNELVHSSSVLEKHNRKRKIDLLPVFEMQFIVEKHRNQLALFYRSPDYVNMCWSVWHGVLLPNNEMHALLMELSEQLDSMDTVFK